MKELTATLKPGNAALFVLIQEMTADKVLKEIQDAGGTVLKTSLDDTKEKVLRDALAKASTARSPTTANRQTDVTRNSSVIVGVGSPGRSQ